MAERVFAIAQKAQELLQYTARATKPKSCEVNAKDVRIMFKKIAEAKTADELKRCCEVSTGLLDRQECKGFSKSTYRLYGADMRECAKRIVLDVHAANNRFFAKEYMQRIAGINAIMDDCSLLLTYIRICLDEHIIDAQKAGEWTGKTMDVKNLAVAWARADRARAESLRSAEEAAANQRQAQAIASAVYAAINCKDTGR